MSEEHAEHNVKLKATVKQKETNLNTSGKEGVVVCSPTQVNGTKMPEGHVEVGTNRKS
jgi:hypothetical protein